MSLCGFDNIYPSRFPGVELTTIEHAIVERGRSSIRLLAEKLRGESELIDENAITRVEYQRPAGGGEDNREGAKG